MEHGGCRTDRFSVEILRPSGNMIILGKFPIPWRVCVRGGSEGLLIRVAKGEHMPDYQNHYSYLFYNGILKGSWDSSKELVLCTSLW